MRALVAVLVLSLTACTSSSAVSRKPSAAERDELNSRLAGKVVLANLLPPFPPAIVCERAELEETSLKVLRAEFREQKAVPYDAIQSVQFTDYARGARDGV